MSAREFTHEIEIAVAPADVHAFLCDLRNYVALHPLIESIEALPPRPDLANARHYRVVDRIPLGPFRLTTTYRAALESLSEHAVRGYAWQFPAIRLITDYGLEPTGRGTRLRERVRVEAPRLLLGYVTRQASRAHAETLRSMKTLLERA